VDARLAFVHVVDGAVMELERARHPLLVLDGLDVVASDLSVRAGAAVVISGPNAGGKTVALKTMGLAALMLRAGMPIACADGSRMGVWDGVLTDVGDDQSLVKNLSTFSAHVKNVASILDDAGEGTLVLLDELATGTDPREGEALAAAVLDSLCQRGAAVVCTTHYEGLKALALGDPRFTNASVGFDVSTMSPTFQVAFGLPGASSALAVARRFGIPSLVLDRAERFLSREDRDFEQMVERLHHERRALDLARAAAEETRLAAELRARQLEDEIAKLREKGKHAVTRETDELVASVRKAREDIRAAQARLRGKRTDEQELREAARAIDRVANKVAVGGELAPVIEVEDTGPFQGDVRKGSRVFIPRLRADAEVLDVLAGGQLRVAAGALKLTVHAHEARAPRKANEDDSARKSREAASKRASPEPIEVAIQTSDNTCDLRGLRTDDAVRMSEQFLDRSFHEGRRTAFLIHGHGTGALRDAIREMLASSHYVVRSRAGESGEGGDGVTVVYLK
jgi:DNA mismatch repair protein MutS2